MAGNKRLKGNCVVTTVMANLGLDEALAAAGIEIVKTQVGDRYVYEEMRRRGANWAASSPATCCFSTTRPPATGSCPRSRC